MKNHWTKKRNEDFRYRYTFKKCAKKNCTHNARVRGLCIPCYHNMLKERKNNESNKSKSN